MHTAKPKWPHAEAAAVAAQLRGLLAGACERIEVAGSLRRGKASVGDVELLYVPRIGEAVPPGGLLAVPGVNLADSVIAALLDLDVLTKRTNVNGRAMFGERNKLVRHAASGIAVDLFAATRENWWNYLVCRTGGSRSNIALCNAAIARGWKWHPYGPGFSRWHRGALEVQAMRSEREVFEFVALEYREPGERA